MAIIGAILAQGAIWCRSAYSSRLTTLAAYPSSTSTRLLPRPGTSLALQFTHIHFTLQWSGVEAVDHFRACPCIASQGQGVHSSTKHQSEHDAAVTQAVQSTGFTGRAQLWLTSTILTARRQLSWPVEAGDDFNPLLA